LSTQRVRIAPSIISADLTRVGEQLSLLQTAGADWIHYDVEDGHFVPEMGLGIGLLMSIREHTDLPIDVHLMVDRPEPWIERVASYGADHITVHLEACRYPRRTLRLIREQGCKSGLALNPKTPLPDLGFLSDLLDMINVLTTEPEGPDCPFLPAMLSKVRSAAAAVERLDHAVDVVADGGVDAGTASDCVQAGATVLVAGRSVFKGGRVEVNLSELRRQAGGAPD
jgi:ribulose-phosphate 3-epimerase